jgi:hypothetical protein
MSREDKDNKKKKPHRLRKNPGTAEAFAKQRHERNVARGKQTFDPLTNTWSREILTPGGN